MCAHLCVFVCVCVCVCMYVCVRVCVFVILVRCVWLRVCYALKEVCMCVQVQVHVCAWVCMRECEEEIRVYGYKLKNLHKHIKFGLSTTHAQNSLYLPCTHTHVPCTHTHVSLCRTHTSTCIIILTDLDTVFQQRAQFFVPTVRWKKTCTHAAQTLLTRSNPNSCCAQVKTSVRTLFISTQWLLKQAN